MLPGRASRWVVGNGWTLLQVLLLLVVMIGWSAATSQGQDGLVHSGNQSPHDVGMARIRVVRRSWFATRWTGVIVVNFTTVVLTVVPILPTFVGSGRTKCLLLAAARTAKTHDWLLWETTAIVLTATVVFVVIVERALLLSGGIAAAWGLLANSHAELVDVHKLVLHCDQAVGLALHGLLLRGGVRGTKVHKQVTVGLNQSIVVYVGHTVSMFQD